MRFPALVLHAAHDERVGDDEPLEAEFLAQQSVHDGARAGGGGAGGVEGGVGDVGGHDAGHAGVDGGDEGGEVDLQLLARGVHHREDGVRVGDGAAMAGEVLGAGQHPFPLDGIDALGHRGADGVGVGA